MFKKPKILTLIIFTLCMNMHGWPEALTATLRQHPWLAAISIGAPFIVLYTIKKSLIIPGSYERFSRTNSVVTLERGTVKTTRYGSYVYALASLACFASGTYALVKLRWHLKQGT